MAISIALAGNPNSGKTTVFNELTGSSQRVGNWPGVTVEKKEGKYKANREVLIQDLPGIYSLSPYSPDEIVARNYLVNDRPDAIIDIVDASNIERNLYLTTQLLEIGIPVVIALNMMDVVNKNDDTIDTKKLGELLGCEVVETCALNKTGTTEVTEKAIHLSDVHASSHTPWRLNFSEEVEAALSQIGGLVSFLPKVSKNADGKSEIDLRWLSIKLFERDAEATKLAEVPNNILKQIEPIIADIENKLDDDSESIITNERYSFIADVVKQCVVRKDVHAASLSDRIDRIVTNRILALPIFAGVIFIVYFLSISTVGDFLTGWVNDVLFGEIVPGAIGSGLESVGAADWLSGLILDGIVAGVGAVLGFLPQMCVLFICLAILEECGYMARIAFILDRIFRRFGLSGKSFIPILIGTGCGIPGIMASRTIESENDRRMTVITTTFIPCGAKLPVIALIAGALFSDSVWVAPSVYFLGIFAILISGVMLKKTRLFASKVAPFVMELPAYHLPKVSGVLRIMGERAWAFVKRAGTIILVSAIVLWFLMSFGVVEGTFQMVEDTSESILAVIGNAIAPIFSPLGFGDWKSTVATITGLIAKENVVGTFGVLYGFGEVSEDGVEFWSAFAAAYTPLAAYAFLAFNMLCAPCFAAIGAIRREMMSEKWTAFAVTYQCVLAYVIALIIYQLGSLFTGGGFTVATAVAIFFVIVLVYMIFIKKPYKAKKEERLETAQPKAS